MSSETLGQWRHRKQEQFRRAQERHPRLNLLLDQWSDYGTRFGIGLGDGRGFCYGQLEKRNYVPLGWEPEDIVPPDRYDQDMIDMTDEELDAELAKLTAKDGTDVV